MTAATANQSAPERDKHICGATPMECAANEHNAFRKTTKWPGCL